MKEQTIQSTVRLSVVIVAYDSEEVLLPCLRSVGETNPLGEALEVVVVDNKPDTGLQTCLATESYSFRLRYVANVRNSGFGGGNNIGAAVATAPFLLFLNPDTILHEDVFTPTLALLEADDRYVVGYTLTDVEGRINDSYSYFPEYIGIFPLLHLLQRLSFRGFVNHCWLVNRIAWPWGAAFALPKARFDAAGRFDEHIFLCNEEPDLMKRLPERRIRILPQRIVHLEGHGRQVPVSRYLAFLRSTDYYLRKYRISGRRLYWRWVETKQRVKRRVSRDCDANYEEAFRRFKQECLKE